MNRLGVRLALIIGGSVAVVIIVTGLLVNIVLGTRFEQFLTQQQSASRAQAVTYLADLYLGQGSLSLTQPQVRLVADIVGGGVAIFDASGRLVGRTAGMPLTVGPLVDTTPIVADGRAIGTLNVQVRGVAASVRTLATDAFRRAIDQTLLLAGIAAVAVAVIVALIAALGMTRPLAEMAEAAGRLGRGDLSARVPVPDDVESHEVAVAFNTMAENLQRSEQLRRRAASDLAHEIATPVTVLATQLDALADGVIPATPEHLAATRETAGEVARLVGDLHDLAAAEGAALHRATDRVDLVALAAGAVAATRALFVQQGVTLQGPGDEAPGSEPGTSAPFTAALAASSAGAAAGAEVPMAAAVSGAEAASGVAAIPGAAAVRRVAAAPRAKAAGPGAMTAPGARLSPVLSDIDPRQIGRALHNLLTNAAVYTPGGGSVWVSVTREGRAAVIRVADTGPGIPPEHQERVFERFYRADPARRHAAGQPGGTGIGLTVARELARANGGDVRIESTSPRGTTFAIILPAAG